MKQILTVIICLFFIACTTNSSKNESVVSANALASLSDTLSETGLEDMPIEYQVYYVVIADTSKKYSQLQGSMYKLADKMLFEIDTMNRYYDSKKDLICLPETNEDEMYRGDYFPRRSPSATLSLEYMNFYKPGAGEKTIALVAGIYEGEGEANVRLADVKKVMSLAFVIKSEVFVGCMH